MFLSFSRVHDSCNCIMWDVRCWSTCNAQSIVHPLTSRIANFYNNIFLYSKKFVNEIWIQDHTVYIDMWDIDWYDLHYTIARLASHMLQGTFLQHFFIQQASWMKFEFKTYSHEIGTWFDDIVTNVDTPKVNCKRVCIRFDLRSENKLKYINRIICYIKWDQIIIRLILIYI